MQIIEGDLFECKKADVICITTNGVIKANGANVMGAGCAKRAAILWPGIEFTLGRNIQEDGNIPHVLTSKTVEGVPLLQTVPKNHLVPYQIVSFPTKNDWRDSSDPKLIISSAHALVELADSHMWDSIVIPRPGCGLGGLS